MINPEVLELAMLLNKLGQEVEIDQEDVQAYFPDISNAPDIRSFYLPNVSPAFYLGDQKLIRSYQPLTPFGGRRKCLPF